MPFYTNKWESYTFNPGHLVQPGWSITTVFGNYSLEGALLSTSGGGDRSPYYYGSSQLCALSLDDIISVTGWTSYYKYARFSVSSTYRGSGFSGTIGVYLKYMSSSYHGTAITWGTSWNKDTSYKNLYPASGYCTSSTGTVYWKGWDAYGRLSCTYKYYRTGSGTYKSVTICVDCANVSECGNSSSCTSCPSTGKSTACPCCLSKDTMIELVSGEEKRISDIKTGDIVYSLNNGNKVPSKVKMVYIAFPKKDTNIYSVYLSNGKKLSITGHHPIACKDGKYKTIELTEGFDKISETEMLLNDISILSIESYSIADPVYNIATDMDNFIVNDVVIACEDDKIQYKEIKVLNKVKASVKDPCYNSFGYLN